MGANQVGYSVLKIKQIGKINLKQIAADHLINHVS